MAKAEHDFESALTVLQEMTPPETCSFLRGISFPTFRDMKNLPEHERAAQLESALEGLLQAIDIGRNNESKPRKLKTDAASWLKSSHHFVRLFLSVAKEGSAVYPPRNICSLISRLLT